MRMRARSPRSDATWSQERRRPRRRRARRGRRGSRARGVDPTECHALTVDQLDRRRGRSARVRYPSRSQRGEPVVAVAVAARIALASRRPAIVALQPKAARAKRLTASSTSALAAGSLRARCFRSRADRVRPGCAHSACMGRGSRRARRCGAAGSLHAALPRRAAELCDQDVLGVVGHGDLLRFPIGVKGIRPSLASRASSTQTVTGEAPATPQRAASRSSRCSP